jgi:hypothetical protein
MNSIAASTSPDGVRLATAVRRANLALAHLRGGILRIVEAAVETVPVAYTDAVTFGRIGVVFVIATTALIVPLANANPVDFASTHMFIVLALQNSRATVGAFSREKASADATISRVSSTCPGVLSRSARTGTTAQQRSWSNLTEEASLELALAEVAPLRRVIAQSTRTLARLRWSVAGIDRAVRVLVRQTRATLALRPPDLCGDASASAATGFVSVPRSTVTFLRSSRVAFPHSGPTYSELVHKMRGFVAADEMSAIKRLHVFNARLNSLNSRFGPDAYVRMIDALAGKPVSPSA